MQTMCSFSGFPLAVMVALCLQATMRCWGTSLHDILKNNTFPALLVFGDSIVDSGNNNYLKTVVKCDFPPYGRDFTGGRPTGRFSNGKVPSDFLADIFGVKDTLPAYLDRSLTIEDLLTGVTFASGGTGYDPLTAKLVSVLSLPQQMELFGEYKARLAAQVGDHKTDARLSKAAFIICAGSDDLANTYYSTPFRKEQYDIESYTDLMSTKASKFVQDLYGMGARKMGVVSAPPIGCVPSQRTAGGVARGCVEERNQAARLFNAKLSSNLAHLREILPDAKLLYLDIYSPLLALIQNPSRDGFEEAAKGCCGTGLVEVSVLCNPYTPGTCGDVSKFIFWDSYHPTEAAYRILVEGLVRKYAAQFF